MLSGIKLVSVEGATGLAKDRILAYIRHNDETWEAEVYDGFLNGACADISKSHVDSVFEEVFGYSTRIDPTTYQGRAVKKAELNFSGGGEFINCPLEVSELSPGYIYQKLVDNKVGGDVVKEFRVSIICGEIADVIVQHRSVERRLTGRGSGGGRGSFTCEAEDAFSPAEIAGITRFCALMNLDFGELDVLPDVNESRIYILDANKTPTFMTRPAVFRVDRFRTIWRRASKFRMLLQTRNASSPKQTR